MFRLFNRKKQSQPLAATHRHRIASSFQWMIETFGLLHRRERIWQLPVKSSFPYTNLYEDVQFRQLFHQLCKYWDLDPSRLQIAVTNDPGTSIWTGTENKVILSSYTPLPATNNKKAIIRINPACLNNLQLLVCVMARELARAKLIGGHHIHLQEADTEALVDLAVIFFGFGVFMSNNLYASDTDIPVYNSAISVQEVSYANALLCYITGTPESVVVPHFSEQAAAPFTQYLTSLLDTRDTLLHPDQVAASELHYTLYNDLDEAFATRDFEKATTLATTILKKMPGNPIAHNNLGYALLCLKAYEAAIQQFSMAIDKDPWLDKLYAHRGYCSIQMGNLVPAEADLRTALELNNDSAHNWRNMGVYYLVSGVPDNALYHMAEALKKDPGTELINFYLYKIHEQLGHTHEAASFRRRSEELNEYNDSVL